MHYHQYKHDKHIPGYKLTHVLFGNERKSQFDFLTKASLARGSIRQVWKQLK